MISKESAFILPILGWAGFIAVLMRFPRHQTSVIMLCNQVTEASGKAMQDVAKAVEATL